MSVNKYYQKMSSRNIGILTNKEQGILKRSTVAIAGVGGIGGFTAERLVRLGIGYIKIADPELFEPTNLNRQFGCYQSTLNKNKAIVIGRILKDINPFLKLDIYSEGINKANVGGFIKGSNVVIEEVDYNALEATQLLHRECRREKIHIITSFAVGFGCSVFIFSPTGISLDKFLKESISTKGVTQYRLSPQKICPMKLSYIPKTTSKKILSGKQEFMPTISPGVALASVVVATEAAKIILRKKSTVAAPNYYFVDLFNHKITKHK
ncbi:MAG: ThiF family adenylyltransferase [Patescibacteria group bacterium]